MVNTNENKKQEINKKMKNENHSISGHGKMKQL
jgi:hypothetical protein